VVMGPCFRRDDVLAADSIFKQLAARRYSFAISRRDAPELCVNHSP